MTGQVIPQAGIPKLAKIDVSGVTLTDDSDAGVTNYIVQATGREHGGDEIDELKLLVTNAASAVITLSNDLVGDDVNFYRGVSTSTEEHRFEGEVVNVQNLGPGGWILHCRSRMWRAVKHVFSNDYISSDEFSGDPKLIWKDHMTRSGVPVNDTYIQDAPAGVTINRFPVDDSRAYSRADRLVKSLNYRQYYDARVGSARFEPKSFDGSGITLVVGSNIVNRPTWEGLGDELIQKAIVRGAAVEVETEESFTATASQTQFTLQDIPVSIKITVAGTEQVLGINGITDPDNYDYWLDPLVKQVNFLTGLSGGESVVITYTYLVERPVVQQSPTSIAKYATDGSGNEYPYTDVFHLPDITDVDDAVQFADSVLGDGDSVTNGASLRVRNVHGLRANHKVTVQDAEAGVDETTFIDVIEYHYPYDYDVVVVDDLPSQDADVTYSNTERIKRLEEELGRGAKTILVIKALGRRVGVGRRFFKKESRQISAGINGFILDHPKFGVLDTSELDATGEGDAFDSWVLDWQIPGSNQVWEDFGDTEYWNTGGGTATITTATRTASFTAGQYIQSEIFVKGKTFSTALVELGDTTGTLLIEAAEDSGFVTKQTLTADSATALTIDTSEGFYLRITENNASAASITPSFTAFGVMSAPAVKITFA